MLAFACDARQGSEPGAGWAALVSASKVASRIILVTRSDSASKLLADVRQLPATVEVVTVETPFDRHGNVYLRYAVWILRASRFLKSRLRADQSITVIHHVTYASDWMPSPLALLSKRLVVGRRIVWGPVGGSTYPPRQVLGLFPRTFRAKELRRKFLTSLCRAFTINLHRHIVDVAVALNPDTAAKLEGFRRREVSANIALDPTSLPSAERSTRERVVVYAGRPLELKGIRLLLEAHRLAGRNWRLELYGATAADFARFGDVSAPEVDVRGQIDRTELLERLGKVSVLALPSLHDSAPWIAAESAAMGATVVTLDLGGVSMMAGEQARVVPTLPASSLPSRLADAIDLALREASTTTTALSPTWTDSRYEDNLRSWYGV